jgi:hypothetical protein
MTKYFVTAVDTTGIQPYIFGSNRLRENVGASELVRLATGKWALEEVVKAAGADERHNVKDASKIEFKPDFAIEKQTHERVAEVIYAGGGNVVVLFRAEATARDFAYNLTRRALVEAPGLSLVVAHDAFIWEHELPSGDRALSQVVQALIGLKLSARKAARLPSMPLLGLGVTAACDSTGLVAVQANEGKYCDVPLRLRREEPTRLISRETRAKLVASESANERLKELFEPELGEWFGFPSEIDDLGRLKGEESYLAVVHADGNGMGERIKKLAEDFAHSKDNRAYITAMRNFSLTVNEASTEALRQTVRKLTRATRWNEEKKQELIADAIPLKFKDDRYLLPFRPLVFGGDDVTFVCNGQVGLALAAAYLEAFEAETAKRAEPLRGKLQACAGIAIVKMHYPFARAYQLSEGLIKEAKKLGKPKQAAALDWHFANSGLSGTIEEIRHREYTVQAGSLLIRPLLLRPELNDQDGRAWFERIEELVQKFQEGEDWKMKRNKAKALREALRAGPNAVTRFRDTYELSELPALLPGEQDYQKSGWLSGRCVYFDAIELMDQYVSLEEDAR